MTEVEVTAKYEILPYLESSLSVATASNQTAHFSCFNISHLTKDDLNHGLESA